MRQCNPRYLIAVTKIVARRENVTTRIYFQEGKGALCRVHLSLLQLQLRVCRLHEIFSKMILNVYQRYFLTIKLYLCK